MERGSLTGALLLTQDGAGIPDGGLCPCHGAEWGFLLGSFAPDTGQCLRSMEQLVPRALLEQWAVLSRQGSCLLAFY